MAEHKVIEKADSEEKKEETQTAYYKNNTSCSAGIYTYCGQLGLVYHDKALDLDSFGMKSVDSPFELKTVGSANVLKLRYLTAMTTLRCLMGATSLLTRTTRSTGFLMKKAV